MRLRRKKSRKRQFYYRFLLLIFNELKIVYSFD
jgi:hypothetical protein